MATDARMQLPAARPQATTASHRDPAGNPPSGWITVVPATDLAPTADKPLQLKRMIGQLVAAGVTLVCLVALGGSLLSRQIAGRQAVHEVAQTTDLLAESVFQPALTDQMATSVAPASGLDALVRQRILSATVVRVKLWSPAGKILYSDEPRLIGQTFRLDEGALAALSDPRTEADITDLSRPENSFERSQGKLLEVYRPVWTPDGHELLFETYFPYRTVTDRSAELWRGFVGITLSSVALIFLLLMPIVWALLRRTRAAQLQREAMMQRALDASTEERHRIAAALHDGVVQELAAASFAVAGGAEAAAAAGQQELAGRLQAAAATVRTSLGGLRSLVVDIYPPTLHGAGLPAALRDLAASPTGRGPQVSVQLYESAAARLSPQQQQAMFRIAQESLRNTVKHAEASEAAVQLYPDRDGVCLAVTDDGVGFDPSVRPDQHLGLSLMTDVARSIGGELAVRSSPGAGTAWRLWVPIR